MAQKKKVENSPEPLQAGVLKHPKHFYNRIHILVKNRLWLQVIIALILGILAGLIIGPSFGLVDVEVSKIIGEWASIPGILFLKIIQIVVVPLIFVSIIIGLVGARDLKQLRKIGLIFLGYLIFTTAIAVGIAILLASSIRPGEYVPTDSLDFEGSENMSYDIAEFSMPNLKDIPSLIDSSFPTNLFGSIVHGELLSIVFFAIIIGISLLILRKRKSRPLISILSSVQGVCMIIIKWAMLIVPLAVFGMMVKLTSGFGLSTLVGLGSYVLTVLLGLLALIFVYFILVFIFAKITPLDYLRRIKDAQLLAFSTSSSAAVMPLSMKVSEEKLGVRPSIAEFIIPTGAVINMNGTALYQVIAIIFLAQVFGIPLGIPSLLLLSFLVIGASIGTPSVPGAGIAVLAIILTGLGIPTLGIILILGVDRILDMSRTTVNVTSDLTASVIIDRTIKEDS